MATKAKVLKVDTIKEVIIPARGQSAERIFP